MTAFHIHIYFIETDVLSNSIKVIMNFFEKNSFVNVSVFKELHVPSYLCCCHHEFFVPFLLSPKLLDSLEQVFGECSLYEP